MDVDGSVTRVTVTASALVKDLVLQADRLNRGATVDSGLVTLLPGESHTFVVDGTNGSDVSSIVGKVANPNAPLYCASKHALNGYNSGLQQQVAAEVRVEVVLALVAKAEELD